MFTTIPYIIKQKSIANARSSPQANKTNPVLRPLNQSKFLIQTYSHMPISLT